MEGVHKVVEDRGGCAFAGEDFGVFGGEEETTDVGERYDAVGILGGGGGRVGGGSWVRRGSGGVGVQ